MHNKRIVGIMLALIGATLWGLNGTVSQYLFQWQHVDVNWFVTARLLCAGVLLLMVEVLRKKNIFHIWRSPHFIFQLILFSIIGMLGVQYSYMASIADGNAAVATLLQYTAPILIIVYLIVTKQQPFMRIDIVLIVATCVGTWLLLTGGSFKGLSVQMSAVVWGIISAMTLAFYTLYAKTLLAHFSSLMIIGWGMLIAGIGMNFIHPIWSVGQLQFSTATNSALFFTIVFGTAIAFWFFFQSVGYLSAKEATLLGTVEPLMALLSSVMFLALPFTLFQAVGALLILLIVVIISRMPK